MIALALVLLIQSETLPAYADASRCAALTAAHQHALGDEAAESGAAYDASLFWSLAMSERARKDGISSARFERDLLEATGRAEKQLAAKEPAATAELARCVARVPH